MVSHFSPNSVYLLASWTACFAGVIGCQRSVRPTAASVPCKMRLDGDNIVTEVNAVSGPNAARLVSSSAKAQSQGTITVWAGDQPALHVELRLNEAGRVEIREEATGAAKHVYQFSSDGVSMNGSYDGRALETLSVADGRSQIERNGMHYADGTRLDPDLPDRTLAVIQDAMTALQANARTCSEQPVAPQSGEPQPDAGSRHVELLSPPQNEMPGTAWPCIVCNAGCSTVFVGCVVAAFVAAAGCTIWYGGCLAFGLAACSIVYTGCKIFCIAPGQACCPVDCGWPSCCLQGHVCVDSNSHTCCAIACGTGCCTQGDTCFVNALGAKDCCPTGQDICGVQCCGRGQVCNAVTGKCCAVGAEPCGAAGCCPVGACNDNPTTPMCCPGLVGQAGGRCGPPNSLFCCPPGENCNDTTQTCCTGQPCGVIGCCEPGHCNAFPDAYACCPGALGQPEGPCNGIGATAQHCCPPMQVCVNSEFIQQPGGCCPAPTGGARINYHACIGNRCCRGPCDPTTGLCPFL